MTNDRLDRKPDPDKIAFLRNLPLHVKETLTREEVTAFLDGAHWPESLYEKLKDFMEEME
ncbi:MAG: hypothetical protein OEV91_03380 [Desulfobulbaceae bacterium]|nr:hypothetical protein [Desulfobulbaceae bacterium]